ncbi:phosphotransferase [Ectobacillus antri]|jgi:thiamine kinase-like enzyme/choline kinase/predicted transcriptional regulator|uniref:Phosphotransferase n=1 Tax=Ectobacillus antri TaxID=2486280 RepID=A0ABT6H8S6_9BACI|nr:phosphotransferase [Ectobacillus antri]MDG4657599.1 phosphotransferase [Ectobacillus antri]MDG5755119.1 phosphotransferase [Ectobacillus antri]
MKQEELSILNVINNKTDVNQKDIAKMCGVSVGKINYMINPLIEQKYINRKRVGKSTRYYLTEKGIESLKQGLSSLQDNRVNIHHRSFKPIKQAVILAAGQRKELQNPAGLADLDGQVLLERNVEILKRNGIETIVMVTGYKKELFTRFSEDESITIVENDQYKWTGTMISLACAAKYITDDFLLWESDILIEEYAISKLLNHEERDCVLITNESGSGDEAFVEIRNGNLYKITKDIHQLNKIDGEMVGISKISYNMFKRLLTEFKDNRNPYVNYEYLLLDAARHYKLGYLKIPDAVWAEIDTPQQYHNVVNFVYPRLKRKEAEYQKQQIKEILREALQLNEEEPFTIEPFGGMTNKNYKVTLRNKEYVLRIPGNCTENMINRYEEKFNARIASDLGIDTPIFYFNEHTGVKVAEMIPDAETLNAKSAKRQEHMHLTAELLRTLHTSQAVMKNRFDVFEKIEEYELLLKQANGENFSDYKETRAAVMRMKDIYEALDVTLTPCHNDTLPENFVKSGSGRMYLIDWEYSGMNDPMWDVAAHSLECNFSPEEEELFLQLYFGQPAEEKIKTRILLNKIFQDFLWSIWTQIKEAQGDDFGTYGIDRYNRAKANLTQLFERV